MVGAGASIARTEMMANIVIHRPPVARLRDGG
jgi:hypothetical protein